MHSTRLKVVHDMISGPVMDGGCGIEVFVLRHSNVLLGYYPLHQETFRKAIQVKSLAHKVLPWDLPIEDIRNY